jgi:iron complex transport system substrate-binding protein
MPGRISLSRARAWVCAALSAGLLAATLACGDAPAEREPASASGALRVVSINPSLTAILLALGAGDTIVGVDEFSAVQQPEVGHLPRVGGLFSPSLEAVAALEPDVVVVVPSIEQRDFVGRLREIGIRVLVLENIRFAQVLENIAELGALVARGSEAQQRIDAIERARRAAEAITAERHRPRTLVVLQRDPVFVVGSGGFIDELLTSAGADNLGASFGEPYPQVAVEWIIDQAPEVLIDMSDELGEPGESLKFWSRWPAIPAVASGRVLHLDPKIVTLPGPYLDRALAELVLALHGRDARDELLAAAALGAGG